MKKKLLAGFASIALGTLCGIAAQPSPTTTPTTTQAATAVSSQSWEKEPGWSKELAGLRVQLTGTPSLAPRLGLQFEIKFWNTSHDDLVFCINDPECLSFEVRDFTGQVVKPAHVTNEKFSPCWRTVPAGLKANGLAWAGSDNRDGKLTIGNLQWQLAAGNYTLGGSFSGPSGIERKHFANERLWTGKIELAPHSFTVYGKVAAVKLKASIAKVRANKWPNDLALYVQLAALVEPGMTADQLETVLPPDPAAEPVTEFWSGNCCFLQYALDKNYRVDASGIGDKNVNGNIDIILTSPPKIVPTQDPKAETLSVAPALTPGQV